MLMARLDANVFGNMSAGKGVLIAGKGITRSGQKC